jgi:hypothetical protein
MYDRLNTALEKAMQLASSSGKPQLQHVEEGRRLMAAMHANRSLIEDRLRQLENQYEDNKWAEDWLAASAAAAQGLFLLIHPLMGHGGDSKEGRWVLLSRNRRK